MNLKKKIAIGSLIIAAIVFTFQQSKSWGFWAHQRINRMAVMCLPEEMMPLYKPNIEFLTQHAVDPDKRRNVNADEGIRHYIDLDHYGKYPDVNMPHKWKDAEKKYSADTLNAYGIVPWYVQKMMYRLTDAFKRKDKKKILSVSADIGHYIADAHVPLHTSENYNGQMTNQVGIHSFWESRVPELLGENYDYFVGKAQYIENTQEYIWKIIMESNSELDSVFAFEKLLTKELGEDKKYGIETINSQSVKVYSRDFAIAYNAKLNNMAERRLRTAIINVASFWYTAWVNAGQPDLMNMPEEPMKEEKSDTTDLFKNRVKIIRPH
jgi:hypothetical protein